MSAFEDFIQTELPKRPWTSADGPVESVMVRRGNNPRQLDFVTLTEGQVLTMKGGLLVGADLGGSGGISAVRHYVYDGTATAETTWTIVHNMNSENVVVQVIDATNKIFIPEDMTITDANTVTITFNSAQAGKAYLSFLD